MKSTYPVIKATRHGRKSPISHHIFAFQIKGDATGATRKLITIKHEGRAELRPDLALMRAAHSSPYSWADYEITFEIEWPKDVRLAPCGSEPAAIWEHIDSLI